MLPPELLGCEPEFRPNGSFDPPPVPNILLLLLGGLATGLGIGLGVDFIPVKLANGSDELDG